MKKILTAICHVLIVGQTTLVFLQVGIFFAMTAVHQIESWTTTKS